MECFLVLPIFVALFHSARSDSCPFSYTNEILSDCQFSKWLSWNCTCCGSDVVTYPMANRKRGICCGPGEPIKQCMTRCGYSDTDDTDNGVCGNNCPVMNKPTNCPYEKTTTRKTSTYTSITAINTKATASDTYDSTMEYSNSTKIHIAVIATSSLACVISLVALCCAILALKKKNQKSKVNIEQHTLPGVSRTLNIIRNLEKFETESSEANYTLPKDSVDRPVDAAIKE